MNNTTSVNSLKHAGLSWDEAIRLDAVTEEHILEMQEIIINQEGIIEDLETRVQDTERLIDSLEIEDIIATLRNMNVEGNDILLLEEVVQELINFKERK